MTIFDELIQKTYDLLPQGGKSTAALPDPTSNQGKRSELILGKETAFELGGGSAPCTSCIMYTENEDLVPRDEVVVYGPDLTQLKGDCAFARIALIRTDFIEAQGEQGAYGILENIGLRKYDVFPKGGERRQTGPYRGAAGAERPAGWPCGPRQRSGHQV